MSETETQRSLRAVTVLLEKIIEAVDIDADDTTINVRNSTTGKVYAVLNAGEEIRKAKAEISTFENPTT